MSDVPGDTDFRNFVIVHNTHEDSGANASMLRPSILPLSISMGSVYVARAIPARLRLALADGYRKLTVDTLRNPPGARANYAPQNISWTQIKII